MKQRIYKGTCSEVRKMMSGGLPFGEGLDVAVAMDPIREELLKRLQENSQDANLWDFMNYLSGPEKATTFIGSTKARRTWPYSGIEILGREEVAIPFSLKKTKICPPREIRDHGPPRDKYDYYVEPSFEGVEAVYKEDPEIRLKVPGDSNIYFFDSQLSWRFQGPRGLLEIGGKFFAGYSMKRGSDECNYFAQVKPENHFARNFSFIFCKIPDDLASFGNYEPRGDLDYPYLVGPLEEGK